MFYGERLKIFWNGSLAWAVDYGDNGLYMALSPDSSFLIAGSYFGAKSFLGKLNSADGTVMDSYNAS